MSHARMITLLTRQHNERLLRVTSLRCTQPFLPLVLKELILKALITTAADDIHKYFFHCFLEKIRLDVSSESIARQRIHRKNQALFFRKIKVEN